MIRRDVFHAIADSTRREILNLVSNQLLTLNAVAEKFDVSRPAISKHVKILAECGLVVIHQYGRERYCQAYPEKLHEVALWIERYRDFWVKRTEGFDNYRLREASLLNTIPSKKSVRKPKKHP